MIQDVELGDAEGVCHIYNHYVERTTITFEEEPVPVERMQSRMVEIRSLDLPWVVCRDQNHVLGYAYAGKWKSRSAYRFSVESTVYVDKDHLGKGIGSALYEELLSRLRKTPIHAVVGGIALPNDPSVRLQEKFGFHKIGHFEKIGFKLGRWIDVGYWQLLL
jgi:phosphinothricin acetyltransferase